MKKFAIILSALLFCLLVSHAHPGSLDANGGHYNRKTGEYHYHEGLNQSSGSSYSNGKYYYDYDYISEEQRRKDAIEKRIEIYRTETDKQREALSELKNQQNNCETLFYIFVFLCVVSIIIICKKLSNMSVARNHINVDKPSIKLFNVPYGVSIDKNGLPKGYFKTNKGVASYEVYVKKSGKKYHQCFCEHAEGYYRKYNIMTVPFYYDSCSRCAVNYPDDNKWYNEAQKIPVISPKYKLYKVSSRPLLTLCILASVVAIITMSLYVWGLIETVEPTSATQQIRQIENNIKIFEHIIGDLKLTLYRQ